MIGALAIWLKIEVDWINLGVGTNGLKEAWTNGKYRAITVTALPTSVPGAALLVPVLRRLESFSLEGLVARVRR